MYVPLKTKTNQNQNLNKKPKQINGSILKKIYFSLTNCHSENNDFNCLLNLGINRET